MSFFLLSHVISSAAFQIYINRQADSGIIAVEVAYGFS